MGNIFNRDTDRIFAIFPHLFIDFSTRVVQTLMMKNTYIEESFEIYQSIRSFIFWKGMSAKKRAFFEESMEHYVEFGFSIKYARSTLPNFTGIKFAERGGQQGYLHFSGLRAYIDEFTRVEALSFHKLVYLFRIYFTLLTGVLFVSLVHYLLIRSSPQQKLNDLYRKFCAFIKS